METMEPQTRSEFQQTWDIRLNPTQRIAYESTALYVLLFGEKGSGKSVAGIAALVRHCYEEDDALALIIAPALRSGKEGVFGKLEMMLDFWKNGNIDPQGNRIDQGLGDSFEYTPATLDPQTKDKIIRIRNVHGGWSKVMLISIPYAAVVEKRMKILEPSFVYVDEITELESAEYFTYVTLQLGRRPGIRGPQQYYASCNPEGPSHWVYKIFFEDCVNDETGVHDPDYLVLHVPIAENTDYLQPGYVDKVMKLLKDDTEYKRLVLGMWIDRPSGGAIFRDEFKPEHIRPMLNTEEHRAGMGLQPHPGMVIFCGYDPGPINYCVTFEQLIPTKDGKLIWIVFDELIFVGEKRPDYYVAEELLKKMDFWKKQTRGISPFIHVADQSAFTHIRHDGNYDATRMKTLTNGRVVMRPFMATDKDSKGSVAARIGMVRNALRSGCLFISATCPRTIDAMNLLASEKRKDNEYDDMAGLKPKRSPYLHPFDSMSYPMFHTQLMPSSFVPQIAKPTATVFRAGRG
jgi:hypothetical protein